MAKFWHPFPPPVEGTYHIRKVGSSTTTIRDARVLRGVNGSLWHRSNPVARMRDWEFQFLGNEQWVPYVCLYDLVEGRPTLRERKVTTELPVACCRDEAMYFVRAIPQRWPQFVQVHVEYTEATAEGAPDPAPADLPTV